MKTVVIGCTGKFPIRPGKETERKNKKMYELKINLEREPRFHYGQKLYIVRTGNSKYFNEPCPICNDEKKITLKGIEGLSCPYCQTSYRGRNTNNNIGVHEYRVIECFVNKIELEGEETKSLYGAGGPPKPMIRISGFTREGNGYSGIGTVHLTNSVRVDEYPENPSYNFLDAYVYTTKKGAEVLKKMFVDKEKEELQKFNEEHGTNYEYPFK